MPRTGMDFNVSDFANYAADQGIDLPADEVTTQGLKMMTLQESFRRQRLEIASTERRWWWGKVFGILTVVAGAGGVTYSQVRTEPEEVEVVDPSDVKAEVVMQAGGVVDRVEEVEDDLHDVQERVGSVEEGVSASIELQLQQSEETRLMLLDAIPKASRGKYKTKSSTLKRAEARALKSAEEIDG